MSNGIDPQTQAAIQALITQAHGGTQAPGAGQQMYPTGQPNWAARGGGIFSQPLQQQAANNQKQAMTQNQQAGQMRPTQQLAPNPAQGPAISPNVQTAPNPASQAAPVSGGAGGTVAPQQGEFKRIPLSYPEQNNLLGTLGESWDNLRNEKIEQQRDSQDRTYELQQRATAQQQAQAQAQAARIKTMQDQRPTLLQAALSTPAAFNNPQIQQALVANNEALGIPTVYNPDGTLDRKQFLPNIMQADDKTKAAFFGAARGPAKDAYGEQFSGITPEMLNAGPLLTPKDQVAIDKLKELGLKDSQTNAIAEKRLKITQELATARHDLDYATIGRIEVDTKRDLDNAQKVVAETAQLPQKLANETTRAQAMLNSSQNRSGQGGLGALKYQQAQVRQLQSAFDDDNRQYQSAVTALSTAMGNNADPDSPIIQSLQAQVAATKQQLDTLSPLMAQVNGYYAGEAQGVAAGNTLSGIGGKPVDVSPVGGQKTGRNTGTDPANYDVGGVYTDPNGKKWTKQANGQWLGQ